VFIIANAYFILDVYFGIIMEAHFLCQRLVSFVIWQQSSIQNIGLLTHFFQFNVTTIGVVI